MRRLLFASAALLSILVIAECSLPGLPASVSLKGVSLDKTSSILFAGETERLTAILDPTDATKKDVVWSTDNSGVAAVNSSGLVTGVSAGTAIITVLFRLAC